MDPRQYGPQIFPGLKTLRREPVREPDSGDEATKPRPHGPGRTESPNGRTDGSGEER